MMRKVTYTVLGVFYDSLIKWGIIAGTWIIAAYMMGQ